MRQRAIQVLLIVSVGVLGVARAARAQAPVPDPEQPDRIEQTLGRYGVQPAIDKLGRGASNTLFGWLEIPLTIHRRYTPQDTGTSMLGGFAYGVVRGILRTGVGLYETVTFFLPYPEHFAPILPPLDYFHAGKREHLPLE